jgi:hypothetical protein
LQFYVTALPFEGGWGDVLFTRCNILFTKYNVLKTFTNRYISPILMLIYANRYISPFEGGWGDVFDVLF